MEFLEFKKALQEHFAEMVEEEMYLFTINVDKDLLWNTYLESFPTGTNKMFRKRREYDCSCCRHFIKVIGNVVTIKNNEVHTIWEMNLGDSTFQPVCDALDAFVKSHPITDVFVIKEKKFGINFNYEATDKEIITWNHLYLELPERFVNNIHKSVGEIQGDFRDTRNVFKRSLDEISLDAIDTILELIASNSLYRGEEWKPILSKFRECKLEYDKLSDDKKELYAWKKSTEVGAAIGRIRNHSIGTLLLNVSEDMDLDTAVRKYEEIVAPTNYKRTNAIFSKKMLENAKNTLSELGYLDALQRRFANLDDITINNILFSNRDSAKKIGGLGVDVFEEMEKEIPINPKKFSKVEEISAKDFIENVLPTAKEIEAFVENKHIDNFVSMIAPVNKDAKNMFKWNNSLSWAYTGNITDSDIKKNVKSAGGKVDGVLRFSIMWNESGSDDSDLDAHCKEPNFHIYFGDSHSRRTGGKLDIDITRPCEQRPGEPAVENIIYTDKSRMDKGTYHFYVNQYRFRNSKGFKAEIELNGEIYSYEYNKPVMCDIPVADVTLKADGTFSIDHKLDANSATSSKEVWGVNTNQFVPVSVVCYSPNYFDEQDGIGHRHLFFMLKDCKNPEMPNGFYNEFLKNELMEHRKVFDALGAKCHVENTDNQLSGIGFSMTKRAELIVKVKGATERIMKIKF